MISDEDQIVKTCASLYDIADDGRTVTFMINFKSITAPGSEIAIEVVNVREMMWKFSLKIDEVEDTNVLSLRFMGYPLIYSKLWSCTAKCFLEIVYPSGNEPCVNKSLNLCCNNRNTVLELSKFWSLKKIPVDKSGNFLHPSDGTITAILVCDYPVGISWDSKNRTGYVGLENLGTTCYMNSVLQSFFILKIVRQILFLTPVDDSLCEKEVRIVKALKLIFYELETCQDIVDTRSLCEALEWKEETYNEQEDAHEFCRKLVDKIETVLKKSPYETTFQELFSGELKSYIQCLKVDCSSTKIENFQDIQLSIEGMRDIYESFSEYVKPEFLTDDNKYYSEKYGYQDAKKGLIFKKIPPILLLLLKRFNFDYDMECFIKLSSKFVYPLNLNLDSYIDNENIDLSYPNDYFLFSVIVHFGTIEHGHYFMYGNVDGNGSWKRFDDNNVMNVTSEEAIENNFGSGGKNSKIKVESAYILIYIKESMRNKILVDDNMESISYELLQRIKLSTCQNKFNASLCTSKSKVKIFTDFNIQQKNCTSLFSADLPTGKLYVEKTTKYSNLLRVVAKSQGLEENDVRLWELREVVTYNLVEFLPFFVQKSYDHDIFDTPTTKNPKMFYLEVIGKDHVLGRDILGDYNPVYNSLIVLKCMDSKIINFLGFLVVDVRMKWEDYKNKIIKLLRNVYYAPEKILSSLKMILYDFSNQEAIDFGAFVKHNIKANFTYRLLIKPIEETNDVIYDIGNIVIKFLDIKNSCCPERTFMCTFKPNCCQSEVFASLAACIKHDIRSIQLFHVKDGNKVSLNGLNLSIFRKVMYSNGLNNYITPLNIFYSIEFNTVFSRIDDLQILVYYYEDGMVNSYFEPIFFALSLDNMSTVKKLELEVMRRLAILNLDAPKNFKVWSWSPEDIEHTYHNPKTSIKSICARNHNIFLVEPSKANNCVMNEGEQLFTLYIKHQKYDVGDYNPLYFKLDNDITLGEICHLAKKLLIKLELADPFKFAVLCGSRMKIIKKDSYENKVSNKFFCSKQLTSFIKVSELAFCVIFKD